MPVKTELLKMLALSH